MSETQTEKRLHKMVDDYLRRQNGVTYAKINAELLSARESFLREQERESHDAYIESRQADLGSY